MYLQMMHYHGIAMMAIVKTKFNQNDY